jgi:hypothetical protein
MPRRSLEPSESGRFQCCPSKGLKLVIDSLGFLSFHLSISCHSSLVSRLSPLSHSLILANDLLPTACESITRNITYNDVQAIPYDTLPDGLTPNDGLVARGKMRRKFKRGGVIVNQGDAK